MQRSAPSRTSGSAQTPQNRDVRRHSATGTASAAVAPYLPEGDTTVGTLVDIRHVSASPVGTEALCRVTVTEVDRARIRFAVSVTDAFGDVGTGFHERFIVHSDKFMAKAEAKLR